MLVLLSANEQEDSSGQIQALTPGQPVASQPYLYEVGPNWRPHAPTSACVGARPTIWPISASLSVLVVPWT
ncbi:MAG: hypothetical protein IPO15_14125 [Anaerolineae bacterium]|uniref:hypothetical protein n=1 Tax=Candidatus Amarolinea dominans TaxID=3140696 RepID=UPI0031364799|nr:hypothetical protein [Anaerolineae bacterium]